jgi:adenine-specific DNA-methyltransferase
VPENQITVRPTRGIQQTLIASARSAPTLLPAEARGVVYTKRWVVELLLDLAGYRSELDLAKSRAVEPAAGDGAFLGPMIERLIGSSKNFGRPLSDCQDSLIVYELDDENAGRARVLAADILTAQGIERPLAEQDAYPVSGILLPSGGL